MNEEFCMIMYIAYASFYEKQKKTNICIFTLCNNYTLEEYPRNQKQWLAVWGLRKEWELDRELEEGEVFYCIHTYIF